ncbi:MAG TPA: HesA/MoeB/ThiF family protein [Pricia sp.]|nr:HesA/MoeB/ThiF family protein [Pricia sp.]
MDYERYNRQTILTGFGEEAQKKLRRSKVLVVGAGGLGIPVLTYLNAMGVGTLGIVDDDIVSVSNLHRQVLYCEGDVGRPKVAVTLEKLKAQNSDTLLRAHNSFLSRDNALQIITGYDVVVDASDNFPARYLVNDACVILKKPFVYGALHGFEGQVSVFNYQGGPTYRCLFPTMPGPDEVPDCNENGVLGILPGIIGNFQALETVKVMTGVGEPLSGKLLLFDALSNSFQKIGFSARPENLEIHRLLPSYDLECGTRFADTTDVNGTADVDGTTNVDRAAGSHPAAAFDSASDRKEIDAEAFLGLLEKEILQLIDVRTPKEFARQHLQIAQNIPLSELETRQNEIDFGEKVYLVCQSGQRSKKAVRKLQAFRPDAVYINLSGGMNRIQKHGVTS